ncbi:late transcription factor VLTF-4 [Cetacean poxvirus 1]|nr:late transcription factor VLTF-4 [Cetacean poxvirus 1]
MASWSIPHPTNGSFKTFEDLRRHLKETTDQNNDPEKEPPLQKKKGKCNNNNTKLQSDDENNNNENIDNPLNTVNDVFGNETEEDQPCKGKKQVNKNKTKVPRTKGKKDSNVVQDDSSVNNNATTSPPSPTVSNGDKDDDCECMEPILDLDIALASILNDLKSINTRISAICTILNDIQSMAVSRQYSTFIKTLDILKCLSTGSKCLVTRKKVSSKRLTKP